MYLLSFSFNPILCDPATVPSILWLEIVMSLFIIILQQSINLLSINLFSISSICILFSLFLSSMSDPFLGSYLLNRSSISFLFSYTCFCIFLSITFLYFFPNFLYSYCSYYFLPYSCYFLFYLYLSLFYYYLKIPVIPVMTSVS